MDHKNSSLTDAFAAPYTDIPFTPEEKEAFDRIPALDCTEWTIEEEEAFNLMPALELPILTEELPKLSLRDRFNRRVKLIVEDLLISLENNPYILYLHP